MKFKFVIIATVFLIEVFRPVASLAQSIQDLGTVRVSTSRYQQQGTQVPANVSVLTRSDIRGSHARTVPELLRQLSGLNVSSTGTLKSSTVDIRGFGDTAARNILVLIDGRRINPVDVSAPDLTQVPLDAVEQIEIIRGAGSVLYGDQAVGGVINIVTRKGTGELSGSLSATVGSDDTRELGFEGSGENKKLSYFLTSKYTEQAGFRDNSDLLAKDANARFGYVLNEQMDFDLSLGYHDDRQNLPGGLNPTELETLGPRGTVTPDDVSDTTDRFARLTMGWTPTADFDEPSRLEVGLSYRTRDVKDEFNQYGAFHTRRGIDTSAVDLKYIYKGELSGHDVNFVAGMELSDTENDILGSGTNVDDITISKEEMGAYAQAEVELFRDFYAGVGTRYQRAVYTFDQRNVPVYQEQTPDEWVSSASMKYIYAPGSNVYFGAQQTFRFLATDEWYSTANFPAFGITPGLNLNLRQQTGYQLEAGIRHQVTEDFLLQINPYWMELDNEIYFDPATFGNANLEKTRRLGVEMGQRLRLDRWISLDFLDQTDVFTYYTWQRPIQEKGPYAGSDIPFVARNQINFGVGTRLYSRWRVSLFGNYIGERYPINDLANRAVPVKSHLTFDANVDFLWKNMECFIAVKNLMDRAYSAFVSTNAGLTNTVYYPADGRRFEFGVKVNF